jgi:tetratricopeptide (TPR) repeat protein
MHVEAAEDLRVVLARRPGFVAAKDQLSTVLLAEGLRPERQRPEMVAEGERLGREILAADPRHEAAWQRMSWLAGTYWGNGEVEKSYDLLGFLRGLDPEDSTTALNFASMARRLGRYDEAREALEGVLEAAPDPTDVLNDLAIVHDGMGDRAQAVELWERALAEDPENLNSLENLFTDAWERGDRAAVASYLARGLEAARRRGGPVGRWLWFRDRLRWAPAGHGEG